MKKILAWLNEHYLTEGHEFHEAILDSGLFSEEEVFGGDGTCPDCGTFIRDEGEE